MPDTLQYTKPQSDSTTVALPDTAIVSRPNNTATRYDTAVQQASTTTNRQTTHTTTSDTVPRYDTAATHTNRLNTRADINNADSVSQYDTAAPQITYTYREPVPIDTAAFKGFETPTCAYNTSDSIYGQLNTDVNFKYFEGTIADVFGSSSLKVGDNPFLNTSTSFETGAGIPLHKTTDTALPDALSLGLIICFTLVLASSRKFLRSLFPLLINNRKAHKQFEDDLQSYSFHRRLFFIPSIVAITVILVFAWNYIPFDNNYQFTSLQPFTYIITALLLIAVVKHFMLWLTGYITLSHNFTSELLFNRQLILITSGILLFPIAILLPIYHNAYSINTLLTIAFIIFVISFITTLLRSFMIFYTSRVSLFLWILYLCILEIAPFLALIVLFQ